MLHGAGTPSAHAFDGFPQMEIDRTTIDADWPFAVDRGTLTCVALTTPDIVIFAEPWRDDVPQELGNMTPPRSVIVSAIPSRSSPPSRIARSTFPSTRSRRWCCGWRPTSGSG